MTAKKYFVGLDLGQASDYTALSVLEKAAAEGNEAIYHLRDLQRIRGLPYPKISEKVAAIMQSPPLAGNAALVVDQTGVGAPVVDLLRSGGLKLAAISIHGGDKVSKENDNYRVPKRDLAAVLQVLLQSGRLKISKKLPLASTLQAELLNFKVKIDPKTAHDSYSAWREQDHDDLVLSVALACWWAEHGPPPAPICTPAGSSAPSRWGQHDSTFASRWL